jgi:hypothetical protein
MTWNRKFALFPVKIGHKWAWLEHYEVKFVMFFGRLTPLRRFLDENA